MIHVTPKDANADLMEYGKTALRDLEDMITEGKAKKACPYFASRKLVPGVELVAMPYQVYGCIV